MQSVCLCSVWVCSGCGGVQSVGVCSAHKNCTGDAAGIWQCWPDAACTVYCGVSIVHCAGALNTTVCIIVQREVSSVQFTVSVCSVK